MSGLKVMMDRIESRPLGTRRHTGTRSASAGSGHGVYALCGEQFIPLRCSPDHAPTVAIAYISGRRAFVGPGPECGDPVYDRFIDQPDPIPTDSRNPSPTWTTPSSYGAADQLPGF